MSVDEALCLVASGDRSALEEVYCQTKKTVYYIALSILRDRALAEDAMQAAYLKILSNAARYRRGSNARAWIARIARNEAVTLYRRRRREVSVDEQESASLFGSYAADDYGALIDLARRILKEKEFAVLMLSAAEGYRRREIAELLGIPLPTVTWHYGRAVAKMQSALSPQEQEQAKGTGGGIVDSRELERELRSEAEEHTPDVYDRILSVQAEKDASGEVIAAAHHHRRNLFLACAAAVIVLILACVLPFAFRDNALATVYLSINPSVEFIVEDNEVTGVRSLNRDAALLVAGETFVGLSPEDASEKFVRLSDEKRLITASGIGLYVTGDDSADIERRVRERLTGGTQSYSVHALDQTELDALIAAYDEAAMGDFEDYLERELDHLRDGFSERVRALTATYLSDLAAVNRSDAQSIAAFNQKYLYLGEDCIFEDGDEEIRELEENFAELCRDIDRYGDRFIFDELFDEFLEAVEELYEPEEPDEDDHDDHDDDDDDDERVRGG